MNNKIIVTILVFMSVLFGGCSNKQAKQVPKEPVAKPSIQTNQQTKQVPKENVTKPNIQDNQQVFFGNWIIKKLIAYGPVGTFTNDDIKNIIGKNLSFSKEKASCFGEDATFLNNIAKNPVYTKSVISKSKFESDSLITLDKLGIKSESIIKVNVRDAKGNGCVFYIKDTNTLILFGGGIYLELDRV